MSSESIKSSSDDKYEFNEELFMRGNYMKATEKY